MTYSTAAWRRLMPANARSHNDHWACPKCGLDNSCSGLGRPPDTIETTCHACGLRVNVFIPLDKERPYTADGIMEDQIYAVMDNVYPWSWICLACNKKNRGMEHTYTMGDSKVIETIKSCPSCHRNIKFRYTWPPNC